MWKIYSNNLYSYLYWLVWRPRVHYIASHSFSMTQVALDFHLLILWHWLLWRSIYSVLIYIYLHLILRHRSTVYLFVAMILLIDMDPLCIIFMSMIHLYISHGSIVYYFVAMIIKSFIHFMDSHCIQFGNHVLSFWTWIYLSQGKECMTPISQFWGTLLELKSLEP